MAAVVGHCFSPFLGWRGGKGIATSFGVIIGTSPIVACVALGVFILTTALTRYVSLASVVATASVSVFGLIVRDPVPLIWAYVALLAFEIHRHRHNMKRLFAGTERRFSVKGQTEGRDAGEPPARPVEAEAVVGSEGPTPAGE
jgi:glycerol-3-phosphate acyltransferase PlsY